MHYLYLGIAIITEVVATSALKWSDGFSRLWPSVIAVFGYALSFYYLAIVLKTIPVGVTYAIWSGLGIVLVAAIGAILFKQIPDMAAVIGMGLILAGVVVINLFSKTAGH